MRCKTCKDPLWNIAARRESPGVIRLRAVPAVAGPPVAACAIVLWLTTRGLL